MLLCCVVSLMDWLIEWMCVWWWWMVMVATTIYGKWDVEGIFVIK
jgi:hypothetical protein